MEKKMDVQSIVVDGKTYVPSDSVKSTVVEAVMIDELNDLIGRNWFFRTATNYILGRVEKIIDNKWCVLSGPVWIGETGRFMQFVREGKLNEVEPTINGHCVNLDATIDFIPWIHELPKEQL